MSRVAKKNTVFSPCLGRDIPLLHCRIPGLAESTLPSVVARREARFTEGDIASHINNDSPTKAASREVALSALRSFLKWAGHRGYIRGNPASLVCVNMTKLSHVQREPKVRVPFTEEEVERLLEKATGFWRYAISLSYEAGLRLGDVCCLERESFASPGKVAVWLRKSGARTRVELDLPPHLHALGHELATMSGTSRLCFPLQQSLYQGLKNRAQLSGQFVRLCQSVGITGKSFHCLRHAFATRRHAATGDLEVLRKDMGHRSAETTEG